jgi:hypothetical protein
MVSALERISVKGEYTSEQLRKWFLENLLPELYDAFGDKLPEAVEEVVNRLSGYDWEELFAIQTLRNALKEINKELLPEMAEAAYTTFREFQRLYTSWKKTAEAAVSDIEYAVVQSNLQQIKIAKEAATVGLQAAREELFLAETKRKAVLLGVEALRENVGVLDVIKEKVEEFIRADIEASEARQAFLKAESRLRAEVVREEKVLLRLKQLTVEEELRVRISGEELLEMYLEKVFPALVEGFGDQVPYAIRKTHEEITDLSWEVTRALQELGLMLPKQVRIHAEATAQQFRRIADTFKDAGPEMRQTLIDAWIEVADAYEKMGALPEVLPEDLRVYWGIDKTEELLDDLLRSLKGSTEEARDFQIKRAEEAYTQNKKILESWVEDEEKRNGAIESLDQDLTQNLRQVWLEFLGEQLKETEEFSQRWLEIRNEIRVQEGKSESERLKASRKDQIAALENSLLDVAVYSEAWLGLRHKIRVLAGKTELALDKAFRKDEIEISKWAVSQEEKSTRAWLQRRLELMGLQNASLEDKIKEHWDWRLQYERNAQTAMEYATYEFAERVGDSFDVITRAWGNVLDGMRDGLETIIGDMLHLEEEKNLISESLERSRLEERLQRQRDSYEEGKIDFKRYTLEVEELHRQFAERMEDRQRDMGDRIADVWIWVKNLIAKTLADLLVSVIASHLKEKIIKDVTSVSKVSASIAEGVASIWAKYATLGPPGWALAAAESGTFAALVTAATAPFIAMAKGGLVKNPQLALIGEKGPEIVVPVEKTAGGFSLGLEGLKVLKNFLVSPQGFERVGESMRSLSATEFAREPVMQTVEIQAPPSFGTPTAPVRVVFEGDKIDFSNSIPMIDDKASIDKVYRRVWLESKRRRNAQLTQLLRTEVSV